MAKNQKIILVTKASGEMEPFSPEKVASSLIRAGTSPELAADILKTVEAELYNGITTHEIYTRVFEHLRDVGAHLASKYNLKRAIMQLGPSGYPFEKYLAKVLETEGYKTAVDQQVKGKCVWHEVDVVAQRGREKYMIEAKFHNTAGIRTDTKVALYVYARYLDVSAGDGFTGGWLVTNTKLTHDARIYCDCVGLKYMSWNYPAEFSLRYLVEKSGLYPVTVLAALTRHEKATLLGEGVVTTKELLASLDRIPKAKLDLVKKEAEAVSKQVAPRSKKA